MSSYAGSGQEAPTVSLMPLISFTALAVRVWFRVGVPLVLATYLIQFPVGYALPILGLLND